MDHQVNNRNHHEFRPKGERRVRFADSVGLELVSIFLLYQRFFLSSNGLKQLSNQPHHGALSVKHNHSQQQQQQQQQQSHQDHYQHQAQLQQQQSKQTLSNQQLTQRQSKQPQQTLQQQQHLMAGQQGAVQQRQQEVTNTTSKTSNLCKPSSNYNSHYNYNYNYQYNSSFNNNHHLSTNTHKSPITYAPSCNTTTTGSDPLTSQYVRQFTQPISLVSFRERVKLNKVQLENCTHSTGSGNLTLSCTIRVLNLSYEKSVTVRYTTDEWHSFTDSQANYLPTSCDGWSDRFATCFSVKELQSGQRITFAVMYTYHGDQVCWDNNGGLNYTIKRM